MTFKVCPPHLVIKTAPHCLGVLLELSQAIGIPHITIGFVSIDARWRFYDELAINTMRTVQSETWSGLIGKALATNKVLVYPEDKQYRGDFIPADSRTRYEVAAPISYNGFPTAVLFGDLFEGERGPILRGDELRSLVELCASQICAIWEEDPEGEPQLRRQINAIVQDCISKTDSKRGYVALKTIDGDLEYFDNDNETFLELSQTEGLCGAVFKSGRTLNVPDVWVHPQYVKSDSEISSELVVAIKDGDETVAVLNMESRIREHYGRSDLDFSEAGEQTLRAARAVTDKVLAFRKLGTGNSPLTDVTQEVLRYDGPLEFGEFAAFVAGRLSYAVKARRFSVWVYGSENVKPFDFDGLNLRPREGPGFRALSDEECLIHAPLRSFGETKAILGIVTANPPDMTTVNVIGQTARVASEAIELKRQRRGAAQMEHVIESFLRFPDSITLGSVIDDIKEIVAADHCTIFGKQCIDGDEFLVVAATTAKDLFNHLHSEMFYRVRSPGSDQHDGYTGFVATERTRFHTSNLSDMPQQEREAWSAKGVSWKRGMSEVGDEPIAAFMCDPICSSEGELIGVIRILRRKTEGKLGDFDEGSKRRVEILSRVLGRCYGASGFVTPARSFAGTQSFADRTSDTIRRNR